MESNHINYDFDKGLQRLDNIIDLSDSSFEERDEIPKRDELRFNNGFYVNCSALFVDIRNSSNLPSVHRRPTLAKIYRSYISETVAIMNSIDSCAEINIVGDAVSGIFNTPKKIDIQNLFETVAEISCIIEILNCKLNKKSITPIEVGIGLSYGRALMIKAGYSGSGINDVIWMGEVVNYASKLSNYGNKTLYDKKIMVSHVIRDNLTEDQRGHLEFNFNRNCYHCDVVESEMHEWYKKNCM